MWIRGSRRADRVDLSGCIDFDGFRHLLCGYGLDPDLKTCIDVPSMVCILNVLLRAFTRYSHSPKPPLQSVGAPTFLLHSGS